MGILSFGRHGKHAASANVLRCSFCHMSEEEAGKLISSPGDYAPRAYICNERIEVCNLVLDGGQAERASARAQGIGPPDPPNTPRISAHTSSLVGGSEEQSDYRYAPEKWSIKEVLGHLIDTKRILAYRALPFARNDPTALAGFEAGDYVRAGGFGECNQQHLIEEFAAVRDATVFLFEESSAEARMRRGVVGNHPVYHGRDHWPFGAEPGIQRTSAGIVRGAGAAAGGGRIVRRLVLCRLAAHGRDRDPHGIGRQSSEVRRLIMMQGMKPALTGIVAGLIGAAFGTKLLGGLLFGIGAGDPLTFVFVPLVLLAVAVIACLIPAVRATRLDPTLALRRE